MNQWKGSIRSGIAATITPSAASGKWDSHEVIQSRQSGIWPAVTIGPTPSVRYLVVGGGGGGGCNGGGGGGAGGLLTGTSLAVAIGTAYTITVGAGGAGATGGSAGGTKGTESNIAIGSSYNFNGTTSSLVVSDSPAFKFSTGDFTWEAWIYITAASNGVERQIFSSWNSPTNGYQFFIRGNGRLCWQIYTQNAPDSDALAITALVWTHVAVSRSSGSVKTFINGVLVDTTSGTNNADGSHAFLAIGRASSGGSNFPGYVSNLRLVKGVAVYTGTFTPPYSNLTATQNAGTNISAITGTQTSLLLSGTVLTDSSPNALTISNNNTGFITRNPFTTAAGGGGGASRDAGGIATSGGSGGGGADAYTSPQEPGGKGIAGQGFNGGAGSNSSGAGGGGGAGAIGGAAGTGSGGSSGNGGIGLQSDIIGTSTYYAGGGGGQRCPGLGGGFASGTPTTGGGGSGGNAAGVSGTANTGGGGGAGGGPSGNTATGGSGIVILSYNSGYSVAASTTGSPTVTIVGGNRIYTWTASGSITF